MKKTKATQAEMFRAIAKLVEIVGGTETSVTIKTKNDETVEISTEGLIEFLDYKAEQAERKSGNGKPSAMAEENAKIADFIIEYFKANPNEVMTTNDIVKIIPPEMAEKEITAQKVTHIMGKIADTVKSYKVKRITHYELIKG